MPESPNSFEALPAEASRASVVIVGAGISGLACALRLAARRIPFLLLEQADHVGGLIATRRDQGYLVECGPQSFTLTPALAKLIEDAGLAAELLYAPKGAPRYILCRGQLVAAPMSPVALFTTPLMDRGAKWRLLTEALRTSYPPEPDESIADFIRRKFGSSLLENLVAPLVSGVYAGDAEKLSLRAAFPPLYAGERKHGSVLRGMVRHRNTAPARPTPRGLCSLRRGVGSLPEALGRLLTQSVQVKTRVVSVRPRVAEPHLASAARFDVRLERDGRPETIAASAVVITAEPQAAAQILASTSPEAARLLMSIVSAPVAVCAAGYRREAIPRSLEGFGFLVARGKGPRTNPVGQASPGNGAPRVLGTVWNSSLFPGRAPEGHVLLTSFLGGAMDPEVVSWAEPRIAAAAHGDLTRILEVQQAPVFVSVARHARALPQYNLGHARTLASLAALSPKTPGLFLAGNYFSGPSLGACVAQALQVAEDAERLMAAEIAQNPA